MLYKVQTLEALQRAKNLSDLDKTRVANLVMLEVKSLASKLNLSESEYDNHIDEQYDIFKQERKYFSSTKGSMYIKSFLSELICLFL